MKRFVSEMRVDAPLEKVWAFYSNPNNLPKLTLPNMHLRVLRADTPLRKGSRIVFGVRRGPIHVTWESVIAEFEPPNLFTDLQTKGPFDHWLHRHEFESLDGGTRIRDTLEFGRPRGILHRMATALFLDHEIHELFRYREKVARRLLVENDLD